VFNLWEKLKNTYMQGMHAHYFAILLYFSSALYGDQ